MTDYDLNTKPGLVAHILEAHQGFPSNLTTLPFIEIATAHDIDHEGGAAPGVTHTHEYAPTTPEEESETPDFAEYVKREAEKKMVAAQKRQEQGWQAVAATVQAAGQAKAAFDEARDAGTGVMQAATSFRTAERAMLAAVNAMVELIASEYRL